MDIEKRDELIFGRQIDWDNAIGGVEYFGLGSYCKAPPMNVSIAKQLVDLNFLDMEDYQNCSPTAKEFIQLCEKYPQVHLHGYAVSPHRDDCRVTIEGIVCERDITQKLIIDFSNLCHDADRFEVNEDFLYSWWD